MNLRKILSKLGILIDNESEEEFLLKQDQQVNLEKQVMNFVKYYSGKMDCCTESEVENFIDKMAVWFELRYPDKYFENFNIDEVMFTQNPYLKNNWEEDLGYLSWHEFYNTKTFVNSLNYDESLFLARPVYEDIYLRYFGCKIKLSNRGTILKCGRLGSREYDGKPLGEAIVGMHIKDAYNLLSSRSDTLGVLSEIEKCIADYELRCSLKEGILDAVMYRVVDRGGRFYGALRGLIFAEEFNRDMTKPMQYITNDNFRKIKELINKYLHLGGSLDINCYTDYFDMDDKDILDEICLRDQLAIINESGIYTEEERMLHQGLVNVLAAGVPESIRNPQAKTVEEKRLERKLRKSKNHLK